MTKIKEDIKTTGTGCAEDEGCSTCSRCASSCGCCDDCDCDDELRDLDYLPSGYAVKKTLGITAAAVSLVIGIVCFVKKRKGR